MDFDGVVDRRGTDSLKWGSIGNGNDSRDVIPLWVADMDFTPPEGVIEALRGRMEHHVYGYTIAPPEYFGLLSAWYYRRYGARVGKEAFLIGPGVVPSLGIAVRAFTEPGDGVMIMPPVYYPFTEIIRTNGRIVTEAPLERDRTDGRLSFNAVAADRAFAAAAANGVRTRMLLLCSPHNPGGMVWSGEDLESMLAFARARDLIVISDEIHGDIVFPPSRFVSCAGLTGAVERTVVISAPNKTFNLAGLHISHFVVPDENLRARIRHGMTAAGFSQPNLFSLVAAKAAYGSGEAWLDELLAYLKGNLEYAVGFLNRRVEGVGATMPPGTYLVWADASRLCELKKLPDDRELVSRLEKEGGVKLTPGSVFGTGGKGFVRINVACPRSILAEGLERIERWAEKAST